MRPMEMLLSFTNLAGLALLALPLPTGLRGLRSLALLALAAAGAQTLVEGARAQMVPAYLLAAGLAAAWTVQSRMAAPPNSRTPGALLLAAGILALTVSVALPVISPVFRFPRPTGPFGTGTLTYHWVDEQRGEMLTEDPNDRRELMVQVWYPADADPRAERARYMPDAEVVVREFARVQKRTEFGAVLSNLKQVTTHAVAAAPAAEDQAAYPVLIFVEGLTGFRQMNTFQVEELVSQGYIVAAIDQPYTAAAVVFPDGRVKAMPAIEALRPEISRSYMPQEVTPARHDEKEMAQEIIPYLAQDVSFTLDRLAEINAADPQGILTGKLDLEKSGVIGFSLGGIVAAEACRAEPRLGACLLMDAPVPHSVLRDGLQQPVMILTREADFMRLEREQAGGWPEEEIRAHVEGMRALYESLPGAGYFVEVDGLFHSNFGDIPAWSPLIEGLNLSGPLDYRRGHEIINAYSRMFFDRHVRGMEEEVPEFEGVRVEERGEG